MGKAKTFFRKQPEVCCSIQTTIQAQHLPNFSQAFLVAGKLPWKVTQSVRRQEKQPHKVRTSTNLLRDQKWKETVLTTRLFILSSHLCFALNV